MARFQKLQNDLTGFAAPVHNHVIQAIASALDKGYVIHDL